MKALKKLTMILLTLGTTASFAACDMLNGLLGKDNSDTAGASDNTQTSEVETNQGEELTETELNAAIQVIYNATNLKVVGEASYFDQTSTFTMMFADGKMYHESKEADSNLGEYSYIGKVDGKYYQWSSMDNTVWDRIEYPASSAVNPVSPKTYLENVFTWCSFTYYEFDNKDGMMTFLNFGEPTVKVKVVGGKIVEYHVEEVNGDWKRATITYGNAIIGEFPSITE